MPTTASAGFGTVSESSSYFKLLLQGWFFFPPLLSLFLLFISFLRGFFFFFNYINPASLFEKALQNKWKHLSRGMVAFPELVVPRPGLVQGRVAGA